MCVPEPPHWAEQVMNECMNAKQIKLMKQCTWLAVGRHW